MANFHFVSYLLFLFYGVITTWLLLKSGYIRRTGLSPRLLVALFWLYIIVGCIHGKILEKDVVADTWGYHKFGGWEYDIYKKSPREYFLNLFQTGYSHGFDGVFRTRDSYWNDLKTNLMAKLVSVFHVMTGMRYYVNLILFNFLIFFGHAGLFRFFRRYYPDATGWLVVAVFLLPSVIFFGGTLHKDGLMLALLGLLLQQSDALWYREGKSGLRLLVIVLSLLLMFFLRNYMVLLLVPLLLVAALKRTMGWRLRWMIPGLLILGGGLFFGIGHWVPSVNPPMLFIDKQTEFLALEPARTTLPLQKLEPGLGSFIKVLPEAAQHAFLRPWPGDYRLSAVLGAFALEWYFYIGLVFLSLRNRRKHPAIVYLLLLYSLLMCLSFGYTVPVLAAIIRYRAIFLPFLMVPVLSQLTWFHKGFFEKLK